MTDQRAMGILPILIALLAPFALAGERETQGDHEAAAEVALFEAVKSGDVEVKFIPHDATSGTVVIANKTQAPLSIRLPEAFAGVPVLAQIGFPNGNNNNPNRGNNGGNAGNQAVGGGFGGGALGGGPGGVFNIDSGRARKLKVALVCLEHGKPDPAPRVPYDLVPLDSYTGDTKVIELVHMLGRGEINQPAAQAAAWHLANGLSWQQLASKVGVKHLSGISEPFFTAEELGRARQIVEAASLLAGKSPAVASSGYQSSQPLVRSCW